MKTIFKSSIISLLIIIGISLIFTNCHKEKPCPVVVTVRLLSDTGQSVSSAYVSVTNSPETGNLQNVSGLSDINGQFTHTFNYEAIMNIRAYKFDTLHDSIYGNALVQLIPGQTVYKTVFIHK